MQVVHHPVGEALLQLADQLEAGRGVAVAGVLKALLNRLNEVIVSADDLMDAVPNLKDAGAYFGKLRLRQKKLNSCSKC